MTLLRHLFVVLGLLLGLPGMAEARMLEEVRRVGVLKVCIGPDNFGISYRNARTGALQGLDIEMSRALGSELGVRVDYVETTLAAVTDDVESGRCNVAMMGLRVTPERLARLALSRPYLRGDLSAATTVANASVRSWEDLDKPGHVVSVLKGTFVEMAMRETLRHAELRAVPRARDRERDVETGRADAFVADFPEVRAVVVNSDWARVVEPDQPVRPVDYAYAVPKGNDLWLARVDAFLARSKRDGTLERAAKANGLAAIVVRD